MKRAVFDLKTRLTMRPDRRALAEMIQAETIPEARTHQIAARRSAELATHAFHAVPYYYDRYRAAGFSALDVAQPENFDRLPALTKADIVDAGESLIATDSSAADRIPSRTGGSTGRPLLVYNDRNAPTAAMWWRMYLWWGVHPYDNAAFIYRRKREGLNKLLYDAEWWPTRHVLLDARGTTLAMTERFERELAKVRPRLLTAYVQGACEFAEYLNRSGKRMRDLAAVSVTASMLHPGQRELIEQALGAPVFDTYRSAEVPWIAAECGAHAGLHVSDRRRVDVVDDDGTPSRGGTVGNLLVTDFDNRVFPLLRYAIGDRSRRLEGVCTCGRTLTRIDHIEGRVADILRTPSGRTVSGGLSALFTAWPDAVRQFQIHQGEDYSVIMRYVPGPDQNLATRAAAEVAANLHNILNEEVHVAPILVASIENVGGKARLVISDVNESSPT